MTYHPPYIADNEDGVSWFGRRDPSRPGGELVPAREARQEFADNACLRRRRVKATLEHMRPAHPFDCPKQPHAPLDQLPDNWRDRLIDEGCECYQVEEGYWHVCDAEHPRAVPVWRCEYRDAPRWVWTTRIWRGRAWDRLYRPRHVLWGGRPERRATWLDRFLSGMPARAIVQGDVQERPRRGAMEPCDVCKRITHHYRVEPLNGRAPYLVCDYPGHHERLNALWRASA